MGAGSDEVKIFDVFAFVVGAEPGGLGEDGFEGEAGAAVGVKGGLEIEGVKQRSVTRRDWRPGR